MYGGTTPGSEVLQTVRAQTMARQIATARIRSQLGPDSLHGASLTTSRREQGEGDSAIECTLRGNRVRRFKDFQPMPAPRPTVRLR
jgi:hypothetical protein